jgi:hypothetical protein
LVRFTHPTWLAVSRSDDERAVWDYARVRRQLAVLGVGWEKD